MRLNRLKHGWWCSQDQDSAPFMLYNDKGNVYCNANPAISSWQYMRIAANKEPVKMVSTWVDGFKAIRYDPVGVNYKTYVTPVNSKVDSAQYAAFGG